MTWNRSWLAVRLARIGLFVTILGWAASALQAGDEAQPMNVLFIICDDLNCDLFCYGDRRIESPNIDRLAQRGVLFRQAHCQYPLCGPSRASFMTSLYPDQTRIQRNAIYLRDRVPNVTSMSQLFRQHGYFATRIGKIYHYNVPNHIGTAGHDDPDSWDYTINPRGRDKDDEDKIFSLRPGKFGGTLSWLAADGTDEEQTDGIGATAADTMLKRFAERRQPFFLAMGFYRPHTPYVAPRADFEKYPTSEIKVPTVPDGYLDTIPAPARNWLTRKKEQVNLDPRLAKQAIQAYHASITFVDRQVGRVLDSLEKHGLAENTVIVFTSDHGYHMGQHGYYQKTTLFEDATHVPLIISVPGMKTAGRSATAPVEMIDIYPTVAQLAGIETPAYISGKSLVPVLENPAKSIRNAALTQLGTGYSIRTARYRYTEWGERGVDGKELYDHQTDPEELVNLAGKAEVADVQLELSKELARRVQLAQKRPRGIRQLNPPRPRAD